MQQESRGVARIYRGTNERGLAFINCLMVVSPSGGLSFTCQGKQHSCFTEATKQRDEFLQISKWMKLHRLHILSDFYFHTLPDTS